MVIAFPPWLGAGFCCLSCRSTRGKAGIVSRYYSTGTASLTISCTLDGGMSPSLAVTWKIPNFSGIV